MFANEPPDMTKWSKDRYNVVEIEQTTPFNYNAKARASDDASDDECEALERVNKGSCAMDSMYA